MLVYSLGLEKLSFGLDLKKFADSANAVANAVVRKVVFDVDASLVMKSPVGNPELWAINSTAKAYNQEALEAGSSDSLGIVKPAGYVGGRFRANWQYGFDNPNRTVTANVDPEGSASISRVEGQISAIASGHKHYLTNSLPYAKRLEEGWSKQAPNGMVALTVAEFIPIVTAAAKALHL